MDSDSSEDAVDIIHCDLEQEENETTSNPAIIQNNHAGPGSSDGTAGEGPHLCEAPGLSTCNHAHSVGGSVSTNTSYTSRHASGNQALEMVEAIVRSSDLTSYDTSVETRGDSGHDVCEVHVHLTQTNINNPAAIALGGQVVVNPPKEVDETSGAPRPTGTQKLRSETEKNCDRWTEGMVKTAATQAILDKILKGKTWITVTGSPGEGKTTAGYLVLKHLNDMGRQVYDIKTPDDYYCTKEIKAPVLMFNDIFGHLRFNTDKAKKWEDVLSEILEMKEHRQGEKLDTRDRGKSGPTVILISRSSVLNTAAHHLGRFRDLVFQGDCVIDFTNGLDIGTDDRLKIWKSHSETYNVQINNNTIREVCKMSLPHGFPHCCRLFAAMYAKNNNLDMNMFFSKPLEFLNQTMESFIVDPVTGPLLREMLRRDGSLDLDNITDDERRFQHRSVAQTLIGTYLSLDNGIVTFHHPSVYDSAAFVVCKHDPQFVIQNCSMPFLNERVRFDCHDAELKNETHHTVIIDSRYIPTFLARLKVEFADRNLSHMLSHKAFHDEHFVSQFMKCTIPMARGTFVSYLIGKARNVFSKTKQIANSVRYLINMKDRTSNKSFLYLMTRSKSEKVLKYVCQFVELSQEEQTDVLLGICEHSSVASLQFFLDSFQDFDLDIKLNGQDTALLVAAGKTSEKILKILLERNVDVFTTDKKENSALHKICRYGVEGDGDVVKMLIDKGADVNGKCPGYPNFPLHIACYRGHKNIVTVLLASGADVNMRTWMSNTPLCNACLMSHMDVITVLLDNGADVNQEDGVGNTSLYRACRRGLLGVVNILLDRGADINKSSSQGGNTPLHKACALHQVEVATLLIRRGADLNLTNDIGATPLYLACDNRCVDAVKVLIKNGADVNKVGGYLDPPLDLTCSKGYQDVLTVLLDKEPPLLWNKYLSGPLFKACRYNEIGIVKLLLDKGANIHSTKFLGDTPLHTACRSLHMDIVELLLDRGADLNGQNSTKNTPLHIACYNGSVNLATFLLDRGSQINIVNSDEDTPLHTACYGGYVDVVTTLLSRGADVNKSNKTGTTPLSYAHSRHFWESAELEKDFKENSTPPLVPT